ncbi:hypothetical protein IJ596_04050 [bacterium]|nr:hypothetical protein [bacterium]
MNFAIYNNGYNNLPITQNKISFKGPEEDINKLKRENDTLRSENVSLRKDRDNYRKEFFIAMASAFLIALGIPTVMYIDKHDNTIYDKRRQEMGNEILKNIGDSTYVFDSIEGKKDSVVNISMTNKLDGTKVKYDLINSRRYEEKTPSGQVIMHDYLSGQNYIKYKDKFVQVDD